MALVTFVNDSAPYLNAENLNNNFEYLDDKIEEVYSTSETLTNKKWIDGKPIYRIALSFTSPSAVNTWKNTYVSMTNPETIVNLSILISYSGYTVSVLNNSSIECAFQQSNLRIVQRVSDSTYLNCNEVAVIEYTKTTD